MSGYSSKHLPMADSYTAARTQPARVKTPFAQAIQTRIQQEVFRNSRISEKPNKRSQLFPFLEKRISFAESCPSHFYNNWV